nr:hypothetical protein [Angustibacter aerolatus]
MIRSGVCWRLLEVLVADHHDVVWARSATDDVRVEQTAPVTAAVREPAPPRPGRGRHRQRRGGRRAARRGGRHPRARGHPPRACRPPCSGTHRSTTSPAC